MAKELMRDVWLLLSAVLIGLIALCTVGYSTFFVMNVQLPFLPLPTVDGTPYYSPPRIISSPLLNNLLFLILFSMQHSFMERGPVRKLLDMFLSKEGVRVVYVLAASVCMASMFLFWVPIPYVIWDVQPMNLRIVVYVTNFLCWLGVVISLLNLDPLYLLGLRPIAERLLNRKKEIHFVTNGLYRLMRHPSYTFLFLAYWISPTMTLGHAMYAGVITMYAMLAVAYLEEPDLVDLLGHKYSDYMKTTPRYFPTISSMSKLSFSSTESNFKKEE